MVGTAGQLPERAYRLSATGRAPRLDGRHTDICPHGAVQLRRQGLLPQMDARPAQLATRRWRLPRHCPLQQLLGLWHSSVGRCRRDSAMDGVCDDGRPHHTGRELREHDALYAVAIDSGGDGGGYTLHPHRCRHCHGRLAGLRSHREPLRKHGLLCLCGPTDG